jgi:trk system potassium uptake protein TrkH
MLICWSIILRLLGIFVIGVSVTQFVPLILALLDGDASRWSLIGSIGLGFAVGGAAWMLIRPPEHELTRREGMLFVALAWLVSVTFGALPFAFSPWFAGFTDACFESMSGFTTTGATVIGNVEGLPRSLLLWRAMTHWLGGMGIIVLAIAVLPLLGTGGMELYRAEFSGARSEKLKPRVAETALALWRIYVALTLGEYVLLRWAGMGPFDAVCHAFATLATGGFSTRNASIEAYQSPQIEYIVVVFMVLAGINFTLHYRFMVERRFRAVLWDPEILAYLGVLAVATVALTVPLVWVSRLPLEQSFRLALFQAASLQTTTGFSSADFEQWTPAATFMLLLLMMIGGCTGSTAGGMKVARIVMLVKVVGREFRRMAEKRAVFAIRFGGRAVSENTISNVLNLVYLAFLLCFVACLVLTATGLDLVTSFSAVLACMFNIGPGLGLVGPTENYGHLDSLVKWTLIICMLAGRLEFYTLLVLVTPAFWRK